MSESEFSRRGFIGRAAALGGSMLALGATKGFAAETPRKGGLLRLGLAGGGPADSLEIGDYVDSVMIVVGRGLYNGLVEWGEDGRAKPDLAVNWEARNGAREWIFNLRKGIKFSNGKEFGADDAIYSLNYHRGDGKSGAKSALYAVDDIRKLDTRQIQVSLAVDDADFPYRLTDHHILMVPDGFKDWASPIGTGAFRLAEFVPGARVALKKNPGYWKDGRGNVDAVDIAVVSDPAERLEGLESGQFDIVNRVEPKSASGLEKAVDLKLVRATSGFHLVAAMRIDKAPYENPALRLALKFATDRKQILKALYSGYGAEGNDHPISPTDPYFNASLSPRLRDPDKAAFYFKKAAVKDPSIALQVPESELDSAVDMARSMQASCGACGIRMDVELKPAESYWDKVWLKDAYVASYWNGRAAATHMLEAVYGANGPWNETRWNNEKFEKLLADARGELDESKRKPYVWEMQRMLHDDGGAIIPVFRDWLDAHSERVGGHTPHAGFELDNGLILEKAWLKG